MAKTIIIKNGDDSVHVEYRTNAFGDNIADGEQFTILKQEGLSDAEIALGLDFQNLTTNLPTMKAVALAKSYKMSVIDEATGAETVILA